MNYNPLVSIIVPVYNTKECYLFKCIKSLTLQDYINIEIILVDDGSNEITAEFCDNLALKNDKIKVFHKTNGGVSSARNLGLEKAEGEYILFVDSDDWVDTDYVSTLLNAIQNYNADMAIAKFYYEPTSAMSSIKEFSTQIFNNNELVFNIVSSDQIGGFLWNKIFKAKLIKSKLDTNLHYCEDLDFVLNYAKLVETAVFIDKQIYHYFKNEGSITAFGNYNYKVLSIFTAYDKIIRLYSNNKKIISILYANKLRAGINIRKSYKLNNIKNLNKFIIINKAIFTSLFRVFFTNNIPFKNKLILTAKALMLKK